MAYEIQYDEAVVEHFRYLTAREKTWVAAQVRVQLTHEPLVTTRNRKQLRPNSIATWELRVGDIRVFYEVVSTHLVRVLAVGRKRGNVVIIAGREATL